MARRPRPSARLGVAPAGLPSPSAAPKGCLWPAHEGAPSGRQPRPLLLDALVLAASHRPPREGRPLAADAAVDVLVAVAGAAREHAASVGSVARRRVANITRVASPARSTEAVRGAARRVRHSNAGASARAVGGAAGKRQRQQRGTTALTPAGGAARGWRREEQARTGRKGDQPRIILAHLGSIMLAHLGSSDLHGCGRLSATTATGMSGMRRVRRRDTHDGRPFVLAHQQREAEKQQQENGTATLCLTHQCAALHSNTRHSPSRHV